MTQYISKSDLVAEIESEKKYAQHLGDNAINSSMRQFYDGMKQGCVDILSFLDTLEVKESTEVKEVDLEKEVNTYMTNEMKFLSDDVGYDTLSTIAKHFFKLGLKAQKGE